MVLGIAVVLVVLVGLLFVGWAVGKTAEMPDQIVIDAEEAIEFCAEALPVSVTSVMSYDELRRALRLHLEWVQFYHWAPDGQSDGPVLFEEFDPLDYLMERAEMVDLDISRDHAKAVIEAQSAYLQVVGAIHLDDPVQVEADLADHPMLGSGLNPAALEDGDTDAEPDRN